MQKTLGHLVLDARNRLGLNNQGVADLIGVSLRTVNRHIATGGLTWPDHYAALVQRLYPQDPQLAAEIAAALGKTLPALGVHPPPPPAPAPKAPPPPPQAAKAHADAVVCAAADALDLIPRNARPVVSAIFATVRDLDVDLRSLVTLLAPPKPTPTKP